jgi:hypothetical protein
MMAEDAFFPDDPAMLYTGVGDSYDFGMSASLIDDATLRAANAGGGADRPRLVLAPGGYASLKGAASTSRAGSPSREIGGGQDDEEDEDAFAGVPSPRAQESPY